MMTKPGPPRLSRGPQRARRLHASLVYLGEEPTDHPESDSTCHGPIHFSITLTFPLHTLPDTLSCHRLRAGSSAFRD